MANGMAAKTSGGIRTICLPIGEEEYCRIIDDATQFRGVLNRCHALARELFPEGFEKGYELKDCRKSVKTGLRIRRIELRDGTSYSIRPSFLMPYLSARTEDVKDAPILFGSIVAQGLSVGKRLICVRGTGRQKSVAMRNAMRGAGRIGAAANAVAVAGAGTGR